MKSLRADSGNGENADESAKKRANKNRDGGGKDASGDLKWKTRCASANVRTAIKRIDPIQSSQ